MMHHIITTLGYLKWAWDFLLHFSIFHSHPLNHPELLKTGNYGHDPRTSSTSYHNYEATECPVCLCRIEQGDEIRELRCDHVFHRECLDRWTDRGWPTCPLCRDCLAPRRSINELGIEIIVFKYLSFDSNRDQDTWWLR